MSSTAQSISPSSGHVNTQRETLYYSTAIQPAVLAAQHRLTPEQVTRNNQVAAEIRAQDAVLLAGPVEIGNMIRVPSRRWNPELVRVLKSAGGWRFEKEFSYTLDIVMHSKTYKATITESTWFVPSAPGRLEQIRAVYEYVFSREIATAEMSRQNETLARI